MLVALNLIRESLDEEVLLYKINQLLEIVSLALL